MKLKDRIVVRPFGPASELKGEISQNTYDFLLKKGLIKKSDIVESEGDKLKAEADAAAKKIQDAKDKEIEATRVEALKELAERNADADALKKAKK